MMMTLPLRRRGLAAAAATAIAGTFAVTGDAASAAPPPTQPVVVTVINPGDPATAIDLTPTATVGETAVIRTTSAMIGAVSGPAGTEGYDIESTDVQRATVTAVAPDGGRTLTFSVEESTATANSGDPADAYSSELDLLQGLPLEIDLDRHGAQTAVRAAAGSTPTAEQLAAIAMYAALGETGPIVAPAEPVGVGAAWTSSLRFAANWCDLPIEYAYRLTSVTGNQYTIEYRWSADVSPVVVTPEGAAELAGITVTAAISGAGTLDGDLTTSNSTGVSKGHYRFVYRSGSAEAIDEYDIWTEANTTPD